MTGGQDGLYHYLDSTELLVPGSGSWRLAAVLLPRPMCCMGLATVTNTLFLTGKIAIYYIVITSLAYYFPYVIMGPVHPTDVYTQAALTLRTIVTRSWSSALTPRTGAWLAACWRIEMDTLSPPSTLKMSKNIVLNGLVFYICDPIVIQIIKLNLI